MDSYKQTTKKKNILEATAKLIAKHGFHAVKTSAIAKESEVSDALIFKYFGNLEGLYQAICTDHLQGFCNFSIDAKISGDQEFLNAFIKNFIEHNSGNSIHIVFYVRARMERPDLLEHIPSHITESGLFLELRYRFCSHFGDDKGEIYLSMIWEFLMTRISHSYIADKDQDDSLENYPQFLSELFF